MNFPSQQRDQARPDRDLGAWISGGVEWCFPNHHRTTTLMPADYTIVHNDDGSATVWVGETERTRRLRGIIGITLFPGRSYIQAEYHLTNTNVTTENFLFWANVAVTANKDFRTFWPPSRRSVYFTATPALRSGPYLTRFTTGLITLQASI